MIFSSITFLYYFMPLVLGIYFLVPGQFKNIVLLISSLVFYAWGEPRYVFLMLAVIILGYVAGIFLKKAERERVRKIVLALAVIGDIAILCYFKYADFLIGSWNRLSGADVRLLNIALPVGISFYIFQTISYLVDVYKKEVEAQTSLLRLALYISMFPQLIAGPIVKYHQIDKELSYRKHSVSMCADGIRRFVIGLSKKVLLANSLGELCNIARTTADNSVLMCWMYAIAYTLQVYFDFSGYSDMAIGLGRILGFHFEENFNYPYISASITEFWRRWHISLGTWFREYVYIPLGGNRRGRIRWVVNIAVVWMLTGLWHGASWNYVAWGIYFAVFLMIEKLWLGKLLEKYKILGHIYTILVVMIGFVIFDGVNAVSFIKDITGTSALPLVNEYSLYIAKSYAVTFVIGIVAATPVVKRLKLKRLKNIEVVLYLLLLILVTAALINGSYNPFLYYRF